MSFNDYLREAYGENWAVSTNPTWEFVPNQPYVLATISEEQIDEIAQRVYALIAKAFPALTASLEMEAAAQRIEAEEYDGTNVQYGTPWPPTPPQPEPDPEPAKDERPNRRCPACCMPKDSRYHKEMCKNDA